MDQAVRDVIVRFLGKKARTTIPSENKNHLHQFFHRQPNNHTDVKFGERRLQHEGHDYWKHLGAEQMRRGDLCDALLVDNLTEAEHRLAQHHIRPQLVVI